MKKYFIIIILSIVCFSFKQSEVELKKRKIGDNLATIELPESFLPMTEEEIIAEFASKKKPLAAFRDAQYPCSFGVSSNSTTWDDETLEMFKLFNKSTIMGIHSEVNFLKEEIVTIGNKKYVVFEFKASVKPVRVSVVDEGDLKKYNYVQYTVKDGQMIGFNFSCPLRYMRHWQPTVQKMMQTVQIK